MPFPTFTINPALTSNATPGQTLAMQALFAPTITGADVRWSASGGTVSGNGNTLINWTLGTVPGTYTITATSKWNRYGAFDAPPTGNIGGRVCTNESFNISDSITSEKAIEAAWSCAANFEGVNLGFRLANGDIFYAYILRTSPNWFVQVSKSIGGVVTVLYTHATPLTTGDIVKIGNNASGDFIVNVNGGTIHTEAGAISNGFCADYNPQIPCAGGTYIPPTVQKNGTAIAAQTFTATVTMPVPTPAGPTTGSVCGQSSWTINGATGGTWSATGGAMNPTTGVWSHPTTPGVYTVTYTVGAQTASVNVTILAASAISTTWIYPETYIGAAVQLSHPVTGGTWATSNGTITPSGVWTPATAGAGNVTYTLPGGCVVSFTLPVQARFIPTLTPPVPPVNDCLHVKTGNTVTFHLTGNLANFEFASQNGTITTGGIYTPTTLAGTTDTITILNVLTGEVATIPVCVESSLSICLEPVAVETTFAPVNLEDAQCCESSVVCGQQLSLRIPALRVHIPFASKNGAAPTWDRQVSTVTVGEYRGLRSIGAMGGASGDTIPSGENGRYDWLITASEMSAINEIGLGWSSIDADTSISTIEHALVLRGDKIPEVRQYGTVIWTGTTPVTEGDVLSFGYTSDTLFFLKNAQEQGAEFINALRQPCQTVRLDASLNEQNLVIGGLAEGVTYTLQTPGTVQGVGAVVGDIYYSPSNPPAGGTNQVLVQAEINGIRIWQSKIWLVRPTAKFFDARAFSRGRGDMWILPHGLPTDLDPFGHVKAVRLAPDGSPDANTHPDAIWAGVVDDLEFEYSPKTELLTSDGDAYGETIESEDASLSGKVYAVRSPELTEYIMPAATWGRIQGGLRMGLGGKTCLCTPSVIIVKRATDNCGGSAFDVLQLRRVSFAGSKMRQSYTQKGRAEITINARVFKDYTMPQGYELAYVDFLTNCSGVPTGCAK